MRGQVLTVLVSAITIKWKQKMIRGENTHIRFCFRTLIARAFSASWAGPGRAFLICSLYLASSLSSFLIFSSTLSPLLPICRLCPHSETGKGVNLPNFQRRIMNGILIIDTILKQEYQNMQMKMKMTFSQIIKENIWLDTNYKRRNGRTI